MTGTTPAKRNLRELFDDILSTPFDGLAARPTSVPRGRARARYRPPARSRSDQVFDHSASTADQSSHFAVAYQRRGIALCAHARAAWYGCHCH